MKYVLSDFDGTLTTQNMIGPEFFQVLSFLETHNTKLVIVTGRSISWAHFLLTHFPIEAVIAEGGGVLVKKDLSKVVFSTPEELNELENITLELLDAFNNLSLSEDSFGRLCDRAIELSLLKDQNLFEPVQEFLEGKCNFSCSNVHLNFWIGKISKESASLEFCSERGINVEDTFYFGDAPNDQGMFKSFPQSVGVSNIASYLDQLHFRPATILTGKENEGAKGVLHFLKNSSSSL